MIAEQLIHFTTKNATSFLFILRLWEWLCYIISTVGMFSQMINGKEFRRTRLWSNQDTWYAFPWGTEENHERLQDIRYCCGYSNRVPFKHKYAAISQQKPELYSDKIGPIHADRSVQRSSESYRYIQGVSGGNISILGVDSIGQCENVQMDSRLVLNGYWDRAGWTYKYEAIMNGNNEREITGF
jgi:hypothetical protein